MSETDGKGRIILRNIEGGFWIALLRTDNPVVIHVFGYTGRRGRVEHQDFQIKIDLDAGFLRPMTPERAVVFRCVLEIPRAHVYEL